MSLSNEELAEIFPRTSPYHPLSDKDILKGLALVGIRPNYFTYEQITRIDTVEEVLGPSGFCLIIYEHGKNTGHWCCLFRRPNGDIEFFDGYGFIMDDILETDGFSDYYRDIINFPPYRIAELRESLPTVNLHNRSIRLAYLSYLILVWMTQNPGYKLHYNPYHLQSEDPNMSTCGRWVLARMWLWKKDVKTFGKLFSSVKNPDKMVTDITNHFLKWV